MSESRERTMGVDELIMLRHEFQREVNEAYKKLKFQAGSNFSDIEFEKVYTQSYVACMPDTLLQIKIKLIV